MDRVFAFRDRVLSSPRFIRFAETFPLTRPIARREAGALFDLCSGFIYSQVLLACVRLRLFDHLRAGPLSRDEIARRLGLGEDATARLLTAAVALRLVEERSGGRYGLGRLGAAVLASPGLTAMVEHHGLVYRDLIDPVALLRGEAKAHGAAVASTADKGTHLASYWPYAEGDTGADRDAVSAYTALMAATQPAIAEEVLDAYDFTRHRCLMDVGGGDGTFLRAAARRVPGLDLVLFDVPAVADLADAKFKAANLAHRAKAAGGDFTKELPKGADVVTLVRVLLDHDDDTGLAILSSVRAALPPGGVLVVAEPMAGTRGAEKVAAYFSLYLMAMGRGRPRTEAQLRDLLQRAGFKTVRRRATHQPLLVRVLAATS
ncbi:methyltransferase domain-containing protein [Rhodomicrobium sp. Az07]|uniref:methyltransferase n=1 Tax=Rhodomicrobium sp. Az07 TaxID=2839034 RepID=UPI001BE94B92|nr:methyltransferase [Rhodomicrobium sp. Az07]MBT3070164.1 methyltransferase domain-containing protein [Rhodomicrobium sp. Az07]